jgi:hypothetical protein
MEIENIKELVSSDNNQCYGMRRKEEEEEKKNNRV